MRESILTNLSPCNSVLARIQTLSSLGLFFASFIDLLSVLEFQATSVVLDMVALS